MPAFAPAPPGTALFRLAQVHGGQVVSILGIGEVPLSLSPPDQLPPEGDALVTAWDRAALGVLTADCGAVALGSPQGIHGAVHVGWRGLMSEVVQHAVAAMREKGATEVVASLGPCIGPCCYAFSPDDLEPIGRRYVDAVRAETTGGEPALDLPAAISAALAEVAVALPEEPPPCTACSPGYFSHRRDGSRRRQVMVVWEDPAS